MVRPRQFSASILACALAAPSAAACPTVGAAGPQGVELRIALVGEELATLTLGPVSMSAHAPGGGWLTAALPGDDILLSVDAPGGDQCVARMSLPPASYNQVRLTVERDATLVLSGGAEVEATVPSGRLRVNQGSVAAVVAALRDGEMADVPDWVDVILGRADGARAHGIPVVAGSWTRLTLEIVQPDSLHELGNGRWQLKPVLRLRSIELVPDGGPDPRDDSATGTIGPAGGRLVLTDGSGLDIPPGALDEPATFTVARPDPSVLENPVAVPGNGGLEVVGALSVEGPSEPLAIPATLVMPTDRPLQPGLEMFHVVLDEATDEWVPARLSDGSSLALTSFTGMGICAVDSFSVHGFALPPTPDYEGCTLRATRDPENLLIEYRPPSAPGVVLWASPFFADAQIAEMGDEDWRRERWREALLDVVTSSGADDIELLGSVLSGVSYLADATGAAGTLADDGSRILTIEEWDILLAGGSIDAVFDQDGYLRYLRSEAYWLRLRGRIVRVQQTLAQRVARGAGRVGLTVQAMQAFLATELATETELLRVDALRTLLDDCPHADTALDDALDEVRDDVEARSAMTHARFAQILDTADREIIVEDIVADVLTTAASPLATKLLVRVGGLGARAAASVAWAATLAIDVAIDRQKQAELAGRTIALDSLRRNCLDSLASSPALELARRDMGLYARSRAADLTRRYLNLDDQSLFTRAIAWASGYETDETMNAWIRDMTALSSWHLCALRNAGLERTPADVEAASGATDEVDDGDAEVALLGPPEFWHLAAGGWGGDHYWTQSVDPDVSGEINAAEWTLRSDAEGTYEVLIRVPAGEHATATPCYEVEVGGSTSYHSLVQPAHPDSWVALGRFEMPLRSTMTVRMGDLTPDPHLQGHLAVDAARLVPVFDEDPPVVQRVGCSNLGSTPDLASAEALRNPLPNASATAARDGDGWYSAQGFGEVGAVFPERAHLGDDYNSEACPTCDEGQPLVAPGPAEVVFAGNGGRGWGGVVMLRLWRETVPFALPGGGEAWEVVVLLGHVQLSSITVDVGEIVAKGDPVATIGRACATSSCSPHLHLEVIAGGSASTPGPGYTYPIDGNLDRVDPTAFFALNSVAP